MTCKYGDPSCPCQDGDSCHYEGDNPMRPYATCLHGRSLDVTALSDDRRKFLYPDWGLTLVEEPPGQPWRHPTMRPLK